MGDRVGSYDFLPRALSEACGAFCVAGNITLVDILSLADSARVVMRVIPAFAMSSADICRAGYYKLYELLN